MSADGHRSTIPLLKSASIKDESEQVWTVYFYQEFESIFLDNEKSVTADLRKKLCSYLFKESKSFRVALDIATIPFLVGFFYREKEIRFYSPKLSQELFLLKLFQNQHETFKSAYQDFHHHAHLVASLPLAIAPSQLEIVTNRFKLTNFLGEHDYKDLPSLNSTIEALKSQMNLYQSSLFEKISDYSLGLTASFALLRIHLLKFLAILPSLDHDLKGDEVKRVLLEALRRLLKDSHLAKIKKIQGEGKALPWHLSLVVQIKYLFFSILPASILAKVVREAVKLMAKRFIAGESILKAEKSFRSIYTSKRDLTLDQLGELVVSENEADRYMTEVLNLIEGFSHHVKKGEKNGAGILRAHVSIKVSALSHDFKPQDFDYTFKKVAPRLRRILLKARECEVFINVDAEHYHFRNLVFKIWRKILLEEKSLHDFAHTGIVLQAYLKDAFEHFQDILDLAKERKLVMPIRLVKGAYWDAETIEARAHHFNSPQFLNKEETDLHFRQLMIEILKNNEQLRLCLASHNYYDHSLAEAVRAKFYPQSALIEHQCLHMTYESLSVAMAKMGWVVRNYVPIGSLLVGMAYLVRRIMENSSQVGVLTIMRSHKRKFKERASEIVHLEKKEKGELDYDETIAKLTDSFQSASPLRLYLDEHLQYVKTAFTQYEKHLGQSFKSSQFPLSGTLQEIFSSSKPELKVGSIQFATKEDALKAVELLDQSYEKSSWSGEDYKSRAALLIRVAGLMYRDRLKLTHLIMFEAGKSIHEALADVDEAIDFLNFYAREEERLQKSNDELMSRGLVAVIAPWNFPLAIPCGMAAAALVAGNTVILKSAEQTPLIAEMLTQLFYDAGLSSNVFIHLPGFGEEVGATLVSHPRVCSVVFTGSKAVGTMIAKTIGLRVYENRRFKQNFPASSITEMGGKNALIVTANAELDETVSAILYSAFAHAGQKCSACSRVLVHHSVKDKLATRLREACQDLLVGEATNFSTTVNPVISKEDKERLQNQVQEAVAEAKRTGGKVIIDRSMDALPGYAVGPVVIELPTKCGFDAKSFSQKELFGPVLHLLPYQTLDQAVALFNATEYALTGGVFSQSQDDIDYLLRKLEAGNIYINRTITGARVGIEPFGGFKLSGSGPKAGGRSYLNAFHLSANITRAPQSNKAYEEQGKPSDFQFELCRPSFTSEKFRSKRIGASIDEVINHFESLFKGIYTLEKESLQELKSWIADEYAAFVSESHANVFVPGQISVDDHQLHQNYVLLVATQRIPHFKSLLYAISALLSGSGVTVLATSQSAYEWWVKFHGLFYRQGISKNNFDVFFPTDSRVESTLGLIEIESVIIDCPDEELVSWLSLVRKGFGQGKHLRRVLCYQDAPELKDFERYLLTFTKVRSLAINIMRHGAPLEVLS
jgi:RHH-type transcriptional regulator, proline utilization regulon repressor / proline dehydrogenase / delta 1-pyrroline-5-carboxylate dehydrogenase